MIHARMAWEHERRRGDRLYQAFCEMERERDRLAAENERLREALNSACNRVSVIIEDSDDLIDRCGVTGQLAEEILADLRPIPVLADPQPAREEP